MFRQAVQSVVFWGHRKWQAVSEIRLLVLPDPVFPCRVCLCVCVVPLCSEGCKCNPRHMLLRLMFFRLMSVVISISPAKTQECSLEPGLIHTRSLIHTHVRKPLGKHSSAAILNDCTMIIWCSDIFWTQPLSKLRQERTRNLTDKLQNKILPQDTPFPATYYCILVPKNTF